MNGEQLRTWRTKHNLTQLQLAELLGTTANTIARWERGETTIQHPKILELALKSLKKNKPYKSHRKAIQNDK